jgi:hypothetical protein
MLFLSFLFGIVCHVSKLTLNDHCSIESEKKIKVYDFHTGKHPELVGNQLFQMQPKFPFDSKFALRIPYYALVVSSENQTRQNVS